MNIITFCSSLYIVYGLKYDYEINIRILSVIHAFVSFFIAAMFLLEYVNINILYNCVFFNQVFLVLDSHLFITNKISNKDIKVMLTHHIIFFLASLFSYYHPIYYSRALLSEISSVFLNLLWFSRNNLFSMWKYKNTLSLCLWVFFMIFRIFNLTQLLFVIIDDKEYIFINLLLPFIFINYYWAYLLTKKGIELLKNK